MGAMVEDEWSQKTTLHRLGSVDAGHRTCATCLAVVYMLSRYEIICTQHTGANVQAQTKAVGRAKGVHAIGNTTANHAACKCLISEGSQVREFEETA
jgi:hypothetical protein